MPQKKLGIPSRLIGKATIAPSSNGLSRTYLTIGKAVQKAFPKWYDAKYPATIKVTVSSPVPMSKTQPVHGPSDEFALFSWK